MKWLDEKFPIGENIRVSGLTKELECLYIIKKLENSENNILLVTNTLYECNQFYARLSTYRDDILIFPMDDFLTTVALAVSPDLKVKRLETLKKIKEGKHIVVTNLMGYLKYLPSVKLNNQEIVVKVDDDINREKLAEILENYGYVCDTLVTSTGSYAVRGYILDVFLIEEEHPIRIEFFGNHIESIRYFDENTQLSLEKINEITINPFKEMESDEKSSLVDYLNDPIIFINDEKQIKTAYLKLQEDILEYKKQNNSNEEYMFNLEDINLNKVIYLDNIENVKGKNTYVYETRELDNFNEDFKLLEEKVKSFIRLNKTVIFVLSKTHQIKEIKEIFPEASIRKDDTFLNKEINIFNKKINKGFIWDNLVVISEFDIENIKEENIKYKNTLKIGKKISSLDSLKLGDYVVHRAHGIGIYNGVVTINQMGILKDFIQINYLGSDKVYIPVEKITSIFKYADADGNKPKINKLGSTSWELKKRQVRSKIKDISEELMKLYAIRSNTKGEAYVDYPMEEMFALEFPYEPTKDQLKAIESIEEDLRSPVPMDRLLCGDVGFGKTEVAFRAMFKTVLNNRQVLYLCPTTILSKQQYTSALQRFSSYPIEIALLNRFTPLKEVKRILEDLETGKIDILFGTHRLLSDDIKCHKLGLLVVDEEQRFGVTHKEKIKSFKNDVNVLTLSATPIPRTLKMAMSGLRDLSIIDTPPINRYPVQTYVVSENDQIVKDAIYKELARNGQIFVLYNKIETISDFCNKIKKLVPEARINYAHGRMTKTELDDIMTDFVDYKFDILVCTTIIETGIDIPNANTLIIYDADRFGLAQLYQIRGRVGRSDKIAYAYLLYGNHKMLNDIAVKRLQAIKDFTELGSGYRIAMRDLSLRGAGDILGSEQAGFVDSVGISLFMKMVEEEIKRLKGEEVIDEENESNKSLVNVSTHISDEYVREEDLKIEIHSLINEIEDMKSLEKVKATLEDRFGKITSDMEIYMYEEIFEKIALKLNITNVKQTERMIDITLPEEISNKVKGDKLFLEAYNINPKFSLKYIDKKIIITLPIKNLEKHFIYYIVPLFNLILEDLG